MREISEETSFTLESTYGSVRPSTRPEDFEELIRIAKDEKVERSPRKLMEE